jgi:hypothetical protein
VPSAAHPVSASRQAQPGHDLRDLAGEFDFTRGYQRRNRRLESQDQTVRTDVGPQAQGGLWADCRKYLANDITRLHGRGNPHAGLHGTEKIPPAKTADGIGSLVSAESRTCLVR